MYKELIDKISDDTENNLNETKATNRLCVHNLTRKLKQKKKKENLSKLVISFTLIFFIGLLIFYIY